MILLYHGIYPDRTAAGRWSISPLMTLTGIKRQILWLTKYYQIVSLPEFLAASPNHGALSRKSIALTFDDGFKVTFDCIAPFLVENNISATFFVSTGHLEHGGLLWFSYLNALCFERLYVTVEVGQKIIHLKTLGQCRQAWRELVSAAKVSGDPVGFSKALARDYPIPPEVASLYEGMTYDQLKEAGRSDLLEIGGHTVTHPYLNQASKDTQAKEILDGRRILSDILAKPIRYFAYPGGEYSYDTIKLVKSAGFEAAFAVTPKLLDGDSRFEVERIGIYSQSLFKFQLKVMGLAKLVRRLGLRIG